MKYLFKNFNLTFLLLTSLFFTTSSFKDATTPPADVQLNITMPYSGNFNEWYITLQHINPGIEEIEFITDDNFNSGILGNIPEGNYSSITFDSGYFPNEGFEIRICGDATYDHCQSTFAGHTAVTFYNVEVGQGANIIIDEGY